MIIDVNLRLVNRVFMASMKLVWKKIKLFLPIRVSAHTIWRLDHSFLMLGAHKSYKNLIGPRFCKRSKTLFKSLLFWLARKVSWLAVEVLSPYWKQKSIFLSFYKTLGRPEFLIVSIISFSHTFLLEC